MTRLGSTVPLHLLSFTAMLAFAGCDVVVGADGRQSGVGAGVDLSSPGMEMTDMPQPTDAEGDMTQPLLVSMCPAGADAGNDPCFGGRSLSFPPECVVGGVEKYKGDTFIARDYQDVLDWLRRPNT